MALCNSGVTNLALVPPAGRHEALTAVADRVGRHIAGSVSVRPFLSAPADARLHLAIVDAGDPACDGLSPRNGGPGLSFALCCDAAGSEHIAFGTNRRGVADRLGVADRRRGQPVRACAEISQRAAELSVQVLQFGGGTEFDLSPELVRIPLAPAPGPARKPPPTILLGGAGGAIAHQVLLAISLDKTLRNAIKGGRFVLCDHDVIEEHNRSRQWLFQASELGESKAERTAAWVRQQLGVETVVLDCRLGDALHELEAIGIFDVAISSVDTWDARRSLQEICRKLRTPWFSAGSGLLSSFARFIDERNPHCKSADYGVEQLACRPSDATESNSCARQPLPSSVLPQMVAASWIACRLRALLCGGALDNVSLARGIEVHLQSPGAGGLRCSPGRRSNLKEA